MSRGVSGRQHMRRSRAPSLILLVFTLVPWMIWAFVILTILEASPHVDEPSDLVLGAILVASLITIALMPFYLYHLYARSRLPDGTRAFWLFHIVFENFLAMPVYWYHHIWHARHSGDV